MMKNTFILVPALLLIGLIGIFISLEFPNYKLDPLWASIFLVILAAAPWTAHLLLRSHDERETEDSTETNAPRAWSFFLGSVGIIVLLLSEHVPDTHHFRELVTHIGVALVIAGLVSLLLEWPDYQHYISKRLANLLMGRAYLRGLHETELQKLRLDIDSVLVGTTEDIERPGGFYKFLHSKFEEALLTSYRTNFIHDSFYLESAEPRVSWPDLPADHLEKTISVTYKLFRGYGKEKTNRIKIPWSTVVYARTLPDFTADDITNAQAIQSGLINPSCQMMKFIAERLNINNNGAIGDSADIQITEFVDSFNTFLKNIDFPSSEVFEEEIRNQKLFSKEIRALAASGVSANYKPSLWRMVLEECFLGSVRQTQAPKSIYLKDLTLVVGLPEKIAKEGKGLKKDKVRTFRFDANKFGLYCATLDAEIELKIYHPKETFDEVAFEVAFEYCVPEGDKFAPEENADVDLEYTIGVKAKGEAVTYRMNLPTRDPIFTLLFPKGTKTYAGSFGYVDAEKVVCGRERVLVHFDGWLLRGHGVSVSYYL